MSGPTSAHIIGVVAGPAVWTLAEYVLHRFAFHEANGRNYGSREHLRHHSSEDSVLESWYLSWAGILFTGLIVFPVALGAIGAHAFGRGLGVGFVAGYAFYDWVHWRAHRRHVASWTVFGVPVSGAYESLIRRQHFAHHFHDPRRNHGVTSPLWDVVFGTYDRVERVRVPRRLALRWLIDDDGNVLERYRHTYELRGRRPLDDIQRDQDRQRAFANRAPEI